MNKDAYREPGAMCGLRVTTFNGMNYPEEFWNCSDIEIKGAGMTERVAGGTKVADSWPCTTEHETLQTPPARCLG